VDGIAQTELAFRMLKMCRPDSIGAGTSQGMAEFGGVTVGDPITGVETGPLDEKTINKPE
jgi:hypothetical protein